jgi:DnaJ-class molecular chaperone
LDWGDAVKNSHALLLVLVIGCVSSAASDRPDIVADLACETARMAVRLSQEMAPAPASDKCQNCDGTGKLGDGRIVTVCPICKGTGKKP